MQRSYFLNLPCFTDISSDKTRTPALDGIRAVAALTVALGHYGRISSSYASLCVWVFFVLSSYLLCTHGMRQDFTKLRVILVFIIRRILRLYPLYLTAIILFSIFGSPNTTDAEGGWLYFLTRSTLNYAEGYLWTVKQEMLFYFLLPFLLLALMPLRLAPTISAYLLLLLASLDVVPFIERHLMVAISPASVLQGGGFAPLELSPFLIGMAGAYFQQCFDKELQNSPLVRQVAGIIIPCCIIGLLPIATISIYYSSFLIMLLIVLIVALPQHPISRCLSIKPLRAIGLVGYGMYMWHWPINVLLSSLHIPHFHGWLYFIIAMIICYIASCITYCLIERPCIKLGRRIF